MSSIEPGDEFISEDELKKVLERWSAPDPSNALDKRVVNSYHQEFRGADALAGSILSSQTKNEVVAMKFCSTCSEEYADKFSFCPVAGTPLDGQVRKVADSTVTSVPVQPSSTAFSLASPPISEPAIAGGPTSSATAANVSNVAPPRGEYHLTIMEDRGLALRLADELRA